MKNSTAHHIASFARNFIHWQERVDRSIADGRDTSTLQWEKKEAALWLGHIKNALAQADREGLPAFDFETGTRDLAALSIEYFNTLEIVTTLHSYDHLQALGAQIKQLIDTMKLDQDIEKWPYMNPLVKIEYVPNPRDRHTSITKYTGPPLATLNQVFGHISRATCTPHYEHMLPKVGSIDLAGYPDNISITVTKNHYAGD